MMIVFKRLGHTIKLSNADWKGIRRRFDLSNAELVGEEHYRIDVGCILCDKYCIKIGMFGYSCAKCPIHKAVDEAHREACAILIGSYFRRVEFGFDEDDVEWKRKDNKKVRKQIKRLNEIMDKIEKDNGW